MTSKIVFHVPKNFIENYKEQSHLALFAKIEETITQNGGTVEVVQRDARLKIENDPDAAALIDDDNLHIVENGWMSAPNVLNATIAYIPPFWHLDPKGVLCNSVISTAEYNPETIPFDVANGMFQRLRKRLVEKRHSRYDQPSEVEEIPKNSIAVFLQGGLPEKQGNAYCTTEEMLRTVHKYSKGHPIVVKAHPISNQIKDAKILSKLMHEGMEFYPTNANVHDILSRCSVTVSFNSAVAMEGFLHRKPAILFGQSDFHHNVETVKTPDEFPDALSQALSKEGGYAQFVYWYFAKHCLSLDEKEFEQKLLMKFANMGFDAKRLGLTQERKPHILQDAFHISQDLTGTLEKQSEIKSCEIIEALKVTESTNVFVARINNEKAIIKQFLHDNAHRTVENLKKELDYIGEKMGHGNLQVNKCLYAFPDEGIAVLSYAEGRRLGDVIEKSPPSKRMQLVKKSGNWLKKYTRPRSRSAKFGPMYWYHLLQDISTDHVKDKTDKALCLRMLENLRQRADTIKGCKVIQAASHGDFVGINAHFSKGVICGVDIQGEHWLPIAKDVAKFLVWLQIYSPIDTDHLTYGIASNDWSAMLASEIISNDEYDTTLAFFVGRELYWRFLEGYNTPKIQKNARFSIENYLENKIRF
ncbi:hypothetical protein F9L33_11305 [Amylibacter sp. SFDW26]|uniref:capsular polysaccharide export protein, LipB/KpsS family n=1 Tax=Amylibacter sp. SFDW26 TaxID=2652722 RepID=UPI0012619716|nr:hypothetical protein [Amylibacter sp. SFDW26]KAB7613935.1 hypothetical protein F9L33_11305 [Amylibacter sp. SFDW26]